MRIPTLLALALLMVVITLGVFLYFFTHHSSSSLAPTEITITNLTDNSVTVIWQTPQLQTGLLSWGDSTSLGNSANDFRDPTNPTPHLNHLVNLTNLKSDTNYYFRVRSGTQFYPDSPLSFKTASTPSDDSSNQAKSNQPIFGVVVDNLMQPVDEALVILQVTGGANLTTLTSPSGNFIISTLNLRTADYLNLLTISDKLPSKLTVQKDNNKSTVSLNLPLAKTLPKIILGKDLDLSSLSASVSASQNPFDLNGDGKINSLDLSIILDSFGTKKGDSKFNPRADLNHDGVVDQLDVDILKAALSK